MLLWAVLTVIAVIVAAAATIPLVRRYEVQPTPKQAVLAVLTDQLADVDAQVAGGTVTPNEADALRLEIKRRMLATGRETEVSARPLGTAALGRVALGLAAVVAVAATALYATLGRPELASSEATAAVGTAANPATGPAGPTGPDGAQPNDVNAMIVQLEARMKSTPNEPEGWRMLGWSYFQTGRYKESADAYGRAVKLLPSGPGYASAWGEALVQAAGGVVTPAAKQAFEQAKTLDIADARARYFLGVAKEQSGDRKGALDDWLALLAQAPADAPWAGELRRVIGVTAKDAGIDVTARLASIVPPAATAAPPVSVTPNPSADQVAAVKAMAPSDQQAMIRGMVDSLAAKLKTNPKDPDGWVRLMRARMVLGDAAGAGVAKRDALAALAGDAGGTATVKAAGVQLGITG